MSAKPHLNLIVMGHVDHGKSTLTVFSIRGGHTICSSAWSTDVCSSDLRSARSCSPGRSEQLLELRRERLADDGLAVVPRSEERRVGKEGRSRWSPYH